MPRIRKLKTKPPVVTPKNAQPTAAEGKAAAQKVLQHLRKRGHSARYTTGLF